MAARSGRLDGIYEVSVAAIILLGVLTACVHPDPVYTLYRNSILDPSMRIHVATFDTREGSNSNPYNQQQCEEIATLLRSNDEDQKRWWCEKGRFRD